MKKLKLKLNKKNLKNLSLDSKVIPNNITAKIVGGGIIVDNPYTVGTKPVTGE